MANWDELDDARLIVSLSSKKKPLKNIMQTRGDDDDDDGDRVYSYCVVGKAWTALNLLCETLDDSFTSTMYLANVLLRRMGEPYAYGKRSFLASSSSTPLVEPTTMSDAVCYFLPPNYVFTQNQPTIGRVRAIALSAQWSVPSAVSLMGMTNGDSKMQEKEDEEVGQTCKYGWITRPSDPEPKQFFWAHRASCQQ